MENMLSLPSLFYLPCSISILTTFQKSYFYKKRKRILSSISTTLNDSRPENSILSKKEKNYSFLTCLFYIARERL